MKFFLSGERLALRCEQSSCRRVPLLLDLAGGGPYREEAPRDRVSHEVVLQVHGENGQEDRLHYRTDLLFHCSAKAEIFR